MEHICYIVGAAPLDGRLPKPQPGDAGYTALREAGLTPDLVIGDFDTLGAPPDHPNVITHSPIKDDTDLILVVRWATEHGYRRFEIYGALGGPRLDMTVASFQTLQMLRSRGARALLVGLSHSIFLPQCFAVSTGVGGSGSAPAKVSVSSM